jgi:hypothetical protein
MPETRGLVQRIEITHTPGFISWCKVYIGPSPTNTRLFGIVLDESVDEQEAGSLAYRTSMTEVLSGALFSRREVIVAQADPNAMSPDAVQVVPG